MVKYSARLKPSEKMAVVVSALKLKQSGSRKVPVGTNKLLAQQYRTSERNIKRILKHAAILQVGTPGAIDFQPKTKNCGRKSMLTLEIRQAIADIIQKHARDFIRCSDRRLKAELNDRGFVASLRTVQVWKKQIVGSPEIDLEGHR